MPGTATKVRDGVTSAPGASPRDPLRVMLVGEDGERPLRSARTAHTVHLRTVTAQQAIHELGRRPADVVLVRLPVCAGTVEFELLGRLRDLSSVGIISLGSTDRVDERIQALDAGADDHLGHPFDDDELLARIRAVRRRTLGPTAARPSAFTPQLEIDLFHREVRRDGRRLHLTATEYRLLECFVSNAGALLAHGTLLQRVWGERYSTESHYLRVYVAQLRKKLGDSANAPRLIETEPGRGYRWIGSTSPDG